jgi:hypothetical protein
MPDLAMLTNNPYLQGNPAFELTPEQKRASMYSAIAHTLIGLGSGISRAGMGGQPWMAGVAPGFEQGANAVSADQSRMFQQNLSAAQTQLQEAFRRAREENLKSQVPGMSKVDKGYFDISAPSYAEWAKANPLPTSGASPSANPQPVVYYGGRAIGSVEDLMKAARINPTTVRTAEQSGYQAGHNHQTANRGLELWRQRNALQRNPYLQMGDP